MAQQRVPNIRLRSWRDNAHMTRAEFADAINKTATGQALNLYCDEERIRRWEAGEVLWPSTEYRKALSEVTHLDPQDLGFLPRYAQERNQLVTAAPPVSVSALETEHEIFGTMELARLFDGGDVGTGTLDALEEATDLLCRAYPKTPSAILKSRIKKRLKHVIDLLGSRITIDQHRRLLVVAGWMMALLGCVHYDMQEPEDAEAARRVALQIAKEAEQPELLAWTYEMAAWFALVEDRYEDVIEAAQTGLNIKGSGSVGVQLRLQEAKGHARLADARETNRALKEASAVLGKLPLPEHPDNHFVFDHSKWMHYAATIYTWLGDDRKAKEHAEEVITDHLRPDGSTRAPMRTAEARLSLATISAREGDLESAVAWGKAAFDFDTKPMADLLSRGKDLDRLLRSQFDGHSLVSEFYDYLASIQAGK
ncbi:MAG TPA: helix-turn-helix transcriptional regulator [Streptosporangiaceae bacterium]